MSGAIAAPFHLAIVSWNGKTDVEYSFLKNLEKEKLDFEFRHYDCKGDVEKCRDLVPLLKQSKTDLILLWSTPACLAIAGTIHDDPKNFIHDIPIIAALITDPYAVHLMDPQKERYRKNLVCLKHVPPIDVQWNIMRLYDHHLQKIAAFYTKNELQSYQQIVALQKIAAQHHAVIIECALDEEQSIDEFLKDCLNEKVEMIYLPSDTGVSFHSKTIIHFANTHHIPTFTTTESMYWEDEPLLGVITPFHQIGEEAAKKAMDILVHQNTPENIPEKSQECYSIVLSQKTTKAGKFIPNLDILKIAVVN